MRIILVFLLLINFGCDQPVNRSVYKVDPAAKKLNDSAVYIAMHSYEYDKAVDLLDKATQIDSNYFGAYRNKMSFQGMIEPFDADKILVILKSLNRLRPQDPEYYMNIGMIYYKKGDTIASSTYFNKALIYFNNILDTMKATTPGYDVLVMGKAYTLFFQGQGQQGHDLLQKLYDTTQDSVAKKMIFPALQKTSKDFISELLSAY
jgi:tetratricopeptide (TPR) repeat protein